MHYVGVDLHKKNISVCVVVQEASKRRVLKRRVFDCRDVEAIEQFFAGLYKCPGSRTQIASCTRRACPGRATDFSVRPGLSAKQTAHQPVASKLAPPSDSCLICQNRTDQDEKAGPTLGVLLHQSMQTIAHVRHVFLPAGAA